MSGENRYAIVFGVGRNYINQFFIERRMSYEANEPCCGCGLEGEGMVTYHHIYTRKAYPELSEVKWNMMPVCLICHNKAHANGLVELSKKDGVFDWLISNGWIFDGFYNKWIHEK